MFSRRLVVLFVLSALALTLVACGNSIEPEAVLAQESAGEDGSITVVGQGQAFGEPDQAQVVLGVEIFADTVQEATSSNEETIQNIMAALADQGVTGADIQTVNYGLWAEQIYGERGPEGIAGYRVTNQINATIRDIGEVGNVLSAVIDAGANSIHGVNFGVADTANLESEARSAAMEDAQRRAEALAELAGVELGDIQIISEIVNSSGYPMPLQGGGAMMEAAVPSIAPGQFSHNMQVQVTFQINR